jgi:hypothetical protein
LTDPQSLHKYLYTHADPVNGIDPTGEVAIFYLLGMMLGGALIGSGIGAVAGVFWEDWMLGQVEEMFGKE